MSHIAHFLYHGNLTDAPGRSEAWDESVQYRGDGRWVLRIDSEEDFFGNTSGDPVRERMGTRALVHWVIVRDAEFATDQDVDDEGEFVPRLGPRAQRLREIAITVGASFCVDCLDGWIEGRWPPRVKLPAVRILVVKGTTLRAVWIGVKHPVVDVETNLGPAFLYLPDENRMARLVMKTERSPDAGRKIKIPKRLMPAIDALPTLAANGLACQFQSPDFR